MQQELLRTNGNQVEEMIRNRLKRIRERYGRLTTYFAAQNPPAEHKPRFVEQGLGINVRQKTR
jgi:hypothetical protein